MRIAPRYLALLALSFLFTAECLAQSAQPQPTPKSASVSGRVTVAGKPAAGITVVAIARGSFLDSRTAGKTTTDEEGNYRLGGLFSGTLSIVPVAKALAVGADSKTRELGQSVNVAEGEAISKVDFALFRGAVVKFSRPSAFCLLPSAFCLLPFASCCLLFAVYCLLFAVYCLLFAVYCLLFAVYSLFTVPQITSPAI